MTRFSAKEGTQPSNGAFVRWKRKRNGLDNEDLKAAIATGYVEEVRSLLARPDRNLEEPYRVAKAVNSVSEVWRTPLEHAVDDGVSEKIIALLLAANGQITPSVLELALDGAMDNWVPVRTSLEFAAADRVCDHLTRCGADWAPALEAYRITGRCRNKERWGVVSTRLSKGVPLLPPAPAGWTPPARRPGHR